MSGTHSTHRGSKNSTNHFSRKTLREQATWKTWHRQEDYVKMNFTDIGREKLNWIQLIQRIIALMMEEACTCETLFDFYETTRRSIPEGCHLQLIPRIEFEMRNIHKVFACSIVSYH
jgi:hypothetical protein